MSKTTVPASMLLRQISAQHQNRQKPKKKKKKQKRVAVSVGDLVVINSPFAHVTGSLGEVMQILDDDRVLLKGMGCNNTVYENQLWVAYTYRPTEVIDGDNADYSWLWIRKVVYARNPPPPKVKKPKTVTVLDGKEALLAALASPEPVGNNTHVVYIPDGQDSEEPNR